MDKEDPLKSLLHEYVKPDVCVTEVLEVIDDALRRCAHDRPARKDCSPAVKRIGAAAKELAAAIEGAGGATGDAWFNLRVAKAISGGSHGADYLAEGRNFDVEVGSAANLVAASRRLSDSASIVEAVLRRNGRPPNDQKIGLGLELVSIWRYATGLDPGYSPQISIDNPATLFSRFVLFSIERSSQKKMLESNFAGWIEKSIVL